MPIQRSKKIDSAKKVVNSVVLDLCNRNKFKSTPQIVRSIRNELYFSENFSISDLGRKITNCVGANYICYKILTKVLPQKKFKLASITYPAFQMSGHLSKHICVLEINDKKIRFIDATPMAGFFNGRISDWVDINEWDKNQNNYTCKRDMSLKDFELMYTHAFTMLQEKQVLDSINYLCLKEDNDPDRFQITDLPIAWHAEQLKDMALNTTSITRRKTLLSKSYKISKNPFTYLKLYPDRMDSEIVMDYVEENKNIIKKINSYIKENTLSETLRREYLAVVYWKTTANKQLLGKKFDFKYIKVGSEKLYLYKIGRSYFKDNNLFLVVTFDEGKKSQVLKVVNSSEASSIDKNKTQVFGSYEAYDKLLLLMSPEVIIQ